MALFDRSLEVQCQFCNGYLDEDGHKAWCPVINPVPEYDDGHCGGAIGSYYGDPPEQCALLANHDGECRP